MNKPTKRMIDFATKLINELGYDIDSYDFDRMSFSEVSELIDELKKELEG